MGNRLVVHVMVEDLETATVYYHWSNDMQDAIKEMVPLASAVKHSSDARAVVRDVIDAVRPYGGISLDEIDHPAAMDAVYDGVGDWLGLIAAPVKDPVTPDLMTSPRNYGLVNASPEGMKDSGAWADGDGWLNVSFSNDGVNKVYWYADTIDGTVECGLDGRVLMQEWTVTDEDIEED